MKKNILFGLLTALCTQSTLLCMDDQEIVRLMQRKWFHTTGLEKTSSPTIKWQNDVIYQGEFYSVACFDNGQISVVRCGTDMDVILRGPEAQKVYNSLCETF